MLKERTVDTGELSINYAEGPPSGPPLVMLHGITTWWQTFLPVLPWLTLRYHTYVLDMRGHGKSSRTPGEYYLQDYAKDTIAFLRSRVNEPAFVLGWSLGSLASVIVAATAPELVKSIVLEDPPLFNLFREPDQKRLAGVIKRQTVWRDVINMNGSEQERLAKLASVQAGDDDSLMRRRLKQLDQCDPETLSFVINGIWTEKYYLDELLPRIDCPTLLMKSDPDFALSASDAEFAISLLSDATLVSLQDVGHDIHTAQPANYARVVSDFLESI